MAWSEYFREGQRAIEDGAFVRARECFEVARREAGQYEAHDPRLGEVVASLGRLENEMGGTWDATAPIDRFVALAEVSPAVDPSDLIDIHRLLAARSRMRKAWERVGQSLEQVLALSENQNGVRHLDVVEAQRELAEHYLELNLPDKAMSLLLEALRTVEGLRGPEHPESVRILLALEEAMARAGRIEEAHEVRGMYSYTVHQAVGKETLEAADDLEHLAQILGAHGAEERARLLLDRALEIRTRQGGADVTSIIRTLERLGHSCVLRAGSELYSAAAVAEGLDFYKRAHSLRENSRDVEPDDRIKSGLELARLFSLADLPVEADEMYRKTLSLAEDQLVATHPLLMETLLALASWSETRGCLDEAERLLGQAASIKESHGRPIDPEEEGPHKELLRFFNLHGKLAEAETLVKSLFTLEGPSLDVHRPLRASILVAWAGLCRSAGRLVETRSALESALAIEVRARGEGHPRVLGILVELVQACCLTGQRRDAEAYYRRAVQARGGIPDLTQIADPAAAAVLGGILEDQGELDEARWLFMHAVQLLLQKKVERSKIAAALGRLAAVLRKQDRNADAEAIEIRARAIDDSP